MKGDEYQKLAMRTCNLSNSKQSILFSDMFVHGILGLVSEAGEVAGLLQKVYQGHEFDEEHMKKELGDCLWMIAEICTALDFSLDDVMQTNIRKLTGVFTVNNVSIITIHTKPNMFALKRKPSITILKQKLNLIGGTLDD